jgi:V/A-type H+-transporting ATPase subunit K
MRYHWWAAGVVLLGLALVPAALAQATAPEAAGTAKAAAAELSAYDVQKTIGLAAAAAFTTAVSIVGAGWALGRIGAAALGAAAEHPELLTRSILFVALAEGLAVLGFGVAILMVVKIV